MNYLKKIELASTISKGNKIKFLNINRVIIFSFTILLTIFFLAFDKINKKNYQKNTGNLKVVTETNDFLNFTNFLLSKINSPYQAVKYQIKNNDTVEKILKRFDISKNDIKVISLKLKQKKLSNIYSGRELNLVFKKDKNEKNQVVNLLFPINNTTSVEVRRVKNDFIVKENILKLYKKEIVVKNSINKNLYSSAMEVKLEPNIIIEFARIFGFEVDFQRDIRN